MYNFFYPGYDTILCLLGHDQVHSWDEQELRMKLMLKKNKTKRYFKIGDVFDRTCDFFITSQDCEPLDYAPSSYNCCQCP